MLSTTCLLSHANTYPKYRNKKHDKQKDYNKYHSYLPTTHTFPPKNQSPSIGMYILRVEADYSLLK